jgi:4-hydroxy-3-methylbut-2-en-1-yl diphosphate reductase
VQRASELDWDEIGPISTLGISAGASAPEVIVDEIIGAFRERYDATVELAITAEETENFLVNRELRGVPLTREDMAFVNG